MQERPQNVRYQSDQTKKPASFPAVKPFSETTISSKDSEAQKDEARPSLLTMNRELTVIEEADDPYKFEESSDAVSVPT